MNPEQLALYQAILSNPDDNAPRMIYADCLEENGDSEQAEFIRAQVYLHKTPKPNTLKIRFEPYLIESQQIYLVVTTDAIRQLEPGTVCDLDYELPGTQHRISINFVYVGIADVNELPKEHERELKRYFMYAKMGYALKFRREWGAWPERSAYEKAYRGQLYFLKEHWERLTYFKPKINPEDIEIVIDKAREQAVALDINQRDVLVSFPLSVYRDYGSYYGQGFDIPNYNRRFALGTYHFARGFPVGMYTTFADYLEHCDAVIGRYPVQEWYLLDRQPIQTSLEQFRRIMPGRLTYSQGMPIQTGVGEIFYVERPEPLRETDSVCYWTVEDMSDWMEGDDRHDYELDSALFFYMMQTVTQLTQQKPDLDLGLVAYSDRVLAFLSTRAANFILAVTCADYALTMYHETRKHRNKPLLWRGLNNCCVRSDLKNNNYLLKNS